MITKENNFDLVRLIAALQVVIFHGVQHLKITIPKPLFAIICNFPGVPVFFTISGFLIYWSYERNHDKILEFYKNRFLRIYPGLWACFFLTITVILYFQIVNLGSLTFFNIIAWILTQLSFMQFYTPDILRSFGVGTPNGSLWTITVEIQFYLIVPILFYFASKYKSIARQNIIFIAFAFFSILCYVFFNHLDPETLAGKFSEVLVFPYLYNFIFGIILYKNWSFIKKYLEGKFIYWLLLYSLFFLVFSQLLQLYSISYWPNFFGLVANMILSCLTISLAFTRGFLSHKLLRGFDLSYGLYIYHMIVINCFVELGLQGELILLICVVTITLLLAFFSWTLVEKKALSLKKYILNLTTS